MSGGNASGFCCDLLYSFTELVYIDIYIDSDRSKPCHLLSRPSDAISQNHIWRLRYCCCRHGISNWPFPNAGHPSRLHMEQVCRFFATSIPSHQACPAALVFPSPEVIRFYSQPLAKPADRHFVGSLRLFSKWNSNKTQVNDAAGHFSCQAAKQQSEWRTGMK